MIIMLDIKRYHPGVHLKDALDTLGMRAAEFSLRTGISERSLSALLNGKNDVTFEIAQKLSSFFGDTVNFWMNLQHDYDAYLSREKNHRQDEMDQRLIQEYDIRDYLISLGVANESDPQEVILQKARKFAGVSALTLLNRKDGFVSFKEEKSGGSSHPFAQNYWVASALTEARKKRHRPFDKKRLTEGLASLPHWSLESPSSFVPKLHSLFQEAGVSFVFLPYLNKSNLYGATRWYGQNEVMLAISSKNNRADLFWFTLAHEIAHVLMEHKRGFLYSGDGLEDLEADKMAEALLFPQKDYERFIKEKKSFSPEDVEQFAKQIGVLPLIVTMRLEKDGLIPKEAFSERFCISYKTKDLFAWQ